MTKRRWLIPSTIAAAALLWALTIGASLRAIQRFETTPGTAANARKVWPSESRVPRVDGSWTMVMMIHPRCSCSRASVSELRAVLEKSPSLRPYVLVYKPKEFRDGWERSDVYQAASRLPRTTLLIDESGRESKLFGGFTSGQTFLYDGDGTLRFAGGLTSLRGHAGINRGRVDVIDIVNSGMGTAAHPVFGCAIRTNAEKESR